MAFQHLNRFVAHSTLTDLTGNAKAVGLYLTANIQAQGDWANRYFHSGEKIAEALGMSRKTAYKALGQLIASGLFEAETIHSGSTLRTYSLALDCPEDCQAKNHYTKLERSLRASQALAEVSEPNGKKGLAEVCLSGKNDHTYREAFKRDIDIDIKNLSGFDFESIYLRAVLEALASVAETDKTANQLKLSALIQKQPDLVASKVNDLLAEYSPGNPEAYLSKIATNSPESLLETSDTSGAKEWPEAELNILRLNAQDITGITGEQEVYDEYLRASGAIPNDLYEIAKATGQRFRSLERLVADSRAKFYGFDLEGFSSEPLALALSEWRGARRGEWGTDLEGYTEAERLDGERLEYQKVFNAKQEAVAQAWLEANPDGELDNSLAGEQIEALEAERWSNPELNADREHYSRLILAEIRELPELETLDEYLTSNETLEQIVLPQLQSEFLEFWNAYPARPQGKGRRVTAVKAWCEVRQLQTHRSLMEDLSRAFLGTEPAFIAWPSSWLKKYSETSKAVEADWYVEPENRIARDF
jgi:hypothetical protein